MTYEQWVPLLEQETGCTVLDPDGLRAVIRERKQYALMSKVEATNYFVHNTVRMSPEMVRRAKEFWGLPS